ncbi:hypothetical protein ACIPJS_39580 [Streptomyces sp. NPDC086783]|uniref:hypothetical protein n=1 Tax=Streptomyces sp. NPDC086783 TaxID=3365758 RepID=UPI0037F211CB
MIDLAIKQALRSKCRHRVGAVLTAGSRVLAASPNLRRNNPAVTFTHATFHAEIATLRRTSRTVGTRIYVARVDANGLPQMAKPCLRCEETLTNAGIVRASYTVNPYSVDVIKFNQRD